MPPPSLDGGHSGAEVREGLAEEAGGRNEVGVEDGDELTLSDLEPGLQRSGLVAGPHVAAEVRDGEASRPQPLRCLRHQGRGVVGRVVEHLDLELVGRVVETAGGLQ